MTENTHYTVTVYIAAPETPLKISGGASMPGHMYYVISDGVHEPKSYGFAPLEHGSPSGSGRVVNEDKDDYVNPHYARTIEITKDQYDKLKEFGKNPENYGFDKTYNGLDHNRITFAWSA